MSRARRLRAQAVYEYAILAVVLTALTIAAYSLLLRSATPPQPTLASVTGYPLQWGTSTAGSYVTLELEVTYSNPQPRVLQATLAVYTYDPTQQAYIETASEPLTLYPGGHVARLNVTIFVPGCADPPQCIEEHGTAAILVVNGDPVAGAFVKLAG